MNSYSKICPGCDGRTGEPNPQRWVDVVRCDKPKCVSSRPRDAGRKTLSPAESLAVKEQRRGRFVKILAQIEATGKLPKHYNTEMRRKIIANGWIVRASAGIYKLTDKAAVHILRERLN